MSEQENSNQAKPEEMLNDEQKTRQERLDGLKREARKKMHESGVDEHAKDRAYLQNVIKRNRETFRAEQDAGYQGAFSDYILGNPEGSKKIMEVLDQYPLIDLGSGSGWVYEKVRPKNKLILVDPYNAPSAMVPLSRKNEEIDDGYQKWREPKVVKAEYPSDKDVFDASEIVDDVYYTSDDMLDFASKLPDGYGNFSAFFIDGFVIPDREYTKLLASHIERVLPNEGVFICNKSEEIMHELQFSRGFENVTQQYIIPDPDSKNWTGFYVWKKPMDIINEEREASQQKEK